ncbi:MAG: hypothetical protein MMC33_004361 [Icmadophila ericetorum]|nr:hypothetical protein [Icmadophila ericetorum]
MSINSKQRRKLATYGKSSLRTSFDDFTTAATNDLSQADSRGVTLEIASHKNRDVQLTSNGPDRDGEFTMPSPPYGGWVEKMKATSVSDPTLQKATQAPSIYDVPFTNKEQLTTHDYGHTPRKRRKTKNLSDDNSNGGTSESTSNRSQAHSANGKLDGGLGGSDSHKAQHGGFRKHTVLQSPSTSSQSVEKLPKAPSQLVQNDNSMQPEANRGISKRRKLDQEEGVIISIKTRRIPNTNYSSRIEKQGNSARWESKPSKKIREIASTPIARKGNHLTKSDREQTRLSFEERQMTKRPQQSTSMAASSLPRGTKTVASIDSTVAEADLSHCILERAEACSSQDVAGELEGEESDRSTRYDIFPRHSRKRLVDKLHGQMDAEPEYQQSDRESDELQRDMTNLRPHNFESRLDPLYLISPGRSSGFQKPKQIMTSSGYGASAFQAKIGPYGKSLRATYAQHRSYLSADVDNESVMFKVSLVPPALPAIPNSPVYTTKQSKLFSPCSQPEETNESQDAEGSTVRSIHELREAGGVARAIGEMEAILDDIDDNPDRQVSLKRNGLLDLATKLESPAATQLLFDAGLEIRLLEHMGICTDLIVNILLMISLVHLLASSSPPHNSSLITNHTIVGYLGQFLDNTDDVTIVASDRKSNLSRLSRDRITKMCKSLIRSSIWKDGSPSRITVRLLTLHCLEGIVVQTRELSSPAGALSQSIVEALVDVMISLISMPLQVSRSDVIVEVRLILSILESSTADSNADDTGGTIWTSVAIEKIANILPMLQQSQYAEEEVGKLRTLALRVCLNLTNNNVSSSSIFSKPGIIRAVMSGVVQAFDGRSLHLSGDIPTETLDNLLLSLGFLINLVEWSEEARVLFLDSKEAPVNLLDTLLRLFRVNCPLASEVRSNRALDMEKFTADALQRVSERDIVSSVALGYLSVLLSYLSLNRLIKERMCLQLQGGTLKQLLDAVDEFLRYNRQIANDANCSDPDAEFKAGFTSRLQDVLDQLKQGDDAYVTH